MTFAAFEQDERRYGQYLEPLAQGGRLVGVDLDKLHSPGELACELLQHRTHLPARSAPRRPQINKHWNGRGFRDGCEVVV
jgi:hypothetical protein